MLKNKFISQLTRKGEVNILYGSKKTTGTVYMIVFQVGIYKSYATLRDQNQFDIN